MTEDLYKSIFEDEVSGMTAAERAMVDYQDA